MPLTHILVDFDNKQPPIAELAQLSGDAQRLWIFTSPHSGKFHADYVQALLAHEGRAQLVHCTRAGNNAVDLHIALHLGRLMADQAAANAMPNGDEYVVVSGDKDFVPLLEFVRALGYPVRQVKSLKEALGNGRAPASKKAAAAKKAAVPSTPPAPKSVQAAAPASAQTARPVKAAKAAKTAGKAAAKSAGEKAAAERSAAGASTKAAGKAAPAKAQRAEKSAKADGKAQKAAPASARTTDLGAIVEILRKSANSRPATVGKLGTWLVGRNVAAADADAVIARLTAAKVLRVDGKKVVYAAEPWPAVR